MADNNMKVSDQIALFLKEKGITHAFGIIGSANSHIFDSITNLGYTEIVCVHLEQAATMAMQTYYRTSGKIAVAIVTAGAGSTNAITGVVSAWADSIPGIVISGQENTRFITSMEKLGLRMWGIQGYDSTKMVEDVTKYSVRVMNPDNAVDELERAYQLALDGRPGPVWVDFPQDVQGSRVVPRISKKAQLVPAKSKLRLKDSAVADVVRALRTAKRPLLWLGLGVRIANAIETARSLVDELGVPFLLSWAASDIIDNNNPLHFGRAGVYGQRSANFILQNADLVIAVGTRLSISMIGYDQSELVRGGRLVIVDIDEKELGKITRPNTQKIAADAGGFLAKLRQVAAGGIQRTGWNEWLDYCKAMREKYPSLGPEHADSPGFINSYTFMDRLSEFFLSDEHITTDMGTALLCAHQVLNLSKEQRLMTSTGLGEMGYGLPAAIGISFARNKGRVICLNCDGGMMMNLQELQTIVHHKLPIKIIIFTNDGYLMIKHTQKNLFKGRYSGTDATSGVTCPDYRKVAAAFDLPYISVSTWEDFNRQVPGFLDSDGPAVCEVFMDPEQYFYPKLGLAASADGTIVSPPLEDLSPLVSYEELEAAMLVPIHEKSKQLDRGRNA